MLCNFIKDQLLNCIFENQIQLQIYIFGFLQQMGAEHTANRSGNTVGIQFQKLNVNHEDVKKYQNDAPKGNYARLAAERPKFLPEVQDSINKFKGSSKISGNSNGSKLPTYELLKNPGVFYEGEWKNGLQNGRGIARGTNGTYLQSNFTAGKANGSGIHIYPDGSYYSGDFRDGCFNGKGKFFYKLNEMTYDGQWKDGKPNGQGKQNFKDLGLYKGNFLNGLKHGKGEMQWKDGRQYKGDFSEGYMHGEGVLRKDKGYYKGRFNKNQKVSGQMKTEFGTYDGPFVRGQMSGKGKFTWNNGNVYDGEFKFNKMHGNGIMILKNEQRYVGDWQNGVNTRITQ